MSHSIAPMKNYPFWLIIICLFSFSVTPLCGNNLLVNTHDTLTFDLSVTVSDSGTITLPVMASSDSVINAIDFSFQYDPQGLNFISATSPSPNLFHAEFYNIGDSTFRFTSFSLQAIQQNVPFISLKFDPSDNVIKAEEFNFTETYINGNTADVKFRVPFCPNGNITLVAEPGFTYVWSTGAATQSISTNNTGFYHVSTFNGFGTLISSLTFEVVTGTVPVVTTTPSGIVKFCIGDSVQLSTNQTYATYLWSTGETTPSINVDSAGVYFVMVTNTEGCLGVSDFIDVQTNVLPFVSITPFGPDTICAGDSILIQAASPTAVAYQWSDNRITSSRYVLNEGSYKVTVTDQNNCKNTSVPYIRVNKAFPSDINRDGITNSIDFLLLLGRFNQNCICREDISGNGLVNTEDFLLLLGQYNMRCS